MSAWHFLLSQDKPAGTTSEPSYLWKSLPVFPVSCWLFTYHPCCVLSLLSPHPPPRRLTQHQTNCSRAARADQPFLMQTLHSGLRNR